MDRKEFYKIQAESFKDYAAKNPDRDLLSLFDEWAESKDFSDEDRGEIQRILADRKLNEKEKESRD